MTIGWPSGSQRCEESVVMRDWRATRGADSIAHRVSNRVRRSARSPLQPGFGLSCGARSTPTGAGAWGPHTAACKQRNPQGCTGAQLNAWCESGCAPHSSCSNPDAWDKAKRDAVREVPRFGHRRGQRLLGSTMAAITRNPALRTLHSWIAPRPTSCMVAGDTLTSTKGAPSRSRARRSPASRRAAASDPCTPPAAPRSSAPRPSTCGTSHR